MAYEHKENKGSIFKNDKKEKDTHPDYTGQANVDGTVYNVSAWINESKSGKKYFGLAFSIPKPKDNKPVDPEDLPF
tara:strand:- start:2131 stop:2358 length:228 start_codon:yes stop_codon:yes gene_type:complete